MTDAQRGMPRCMSLPSLRRALLLLLLALMWMQTVGVMHRVAHAHQSAGITMDAPANTSGVLAGIWGEHSNSAECQLFDQTCPDQLHLPVWGMPAMWMASAWLMDVLQERFALFARFYAARGPPVALI